MTLEIELPALPGGAARVLRWLATEDEAVEAGSPLAIVLTERVEALLPAPGAGVLTERAPEGATVEPGGVLGRIAPPEGEQEAAAAEPEGVTGAVSAAPRSNATPLAKTIAAAHAIDLASVTGTWFGGRVCAADVRAALNLAQPTQPVPLSPPPPVPLPPPLPLATATVELDTSAALARVEAQRDAFGRLGLAPGLLACVVEAAAALLAAHPPLNARWGDDAIVLRRRVHIAAAEPGAAGGLRWSIVRDAGDLTLRGVARALAAPAPEPGDSTFAVVCLAPGAAWHSALPPLAGTGAALTVGAPARRAVVHGDGVAVRPVSLLTLSYDARLLDHCAAAAFLTALRERLERG
jgi:pyruvate/2-oxoglutarate dehydrogenase complex dihydrolipoamide acyltransferase (E2) component